MDPDASEVLRFWFGTVGDDPSAAKERLRFWFAGSAMLDREIERRFGGLLRRGQRGELRAWQTDCHECLAYVIVLDQFSRNILRGTAEAFAQDPWALGLATQALEKGWGAVLSPTECAFLFMPFQHSEDAKIQAAGVAAYQRLHDEAAMPWREFLAGFLRSAREHKSIIDRFGRFPHRNAVCGRISSPEEIRYLEGGAQRFGQ